MESLADMAGSAAGALALRHPHGAKRCWLLSFAVSTIKVAGAIMALMPQRMGPLAIVSVSRARRRSGQERSFRPTRPDLQNSFSDHRPPSTPSEAAARRVVAPVNSDVQTHTGVRPPAPCGRAIARSSHRRL